MALPGFNQFGDLPPGIYKTSLDEVSDRFGSGSDRREIVMQKLRYMYDLAKRTGHLNRLVVFGSYITSKSEPNDVDVILVMDETFVLDQCPPESSALFDHAIAQARYGASVFWIRPNMLMSETMDEFIAYWQIKRDGTQRGIVEVREGEDTNDS
jgi:hypothetical protein